MVDPTPLLKVFGAAADVAGQIATDKAINGRRKSKGSTATDATRSLSAQSSSARADYLRDYVDITDGQLVVDFELSEPTVPGIIPHVLGRVPVGVILLMQDAGAAIYCTSAGEDAVGMSATSGKVTVWIF